MDNYEAEKNVRLYLGQSLINNWGEGRNGLDPEDMPENWSDDFKLFEITSHKYDDDDDDDDYEVTIRLPKCFIIEEEGKGTIHVAILNDL